MGPPTEIVLVADGDGTALQAARELFREYAAQLGVQGYLGKPYDEETLLRLIRQHTATAPAAALT